MGVTFFGMLCGCGFAVLVLVVAAALLRLAITLANKFVKPTKAGAARSGAVAEWDWDDWEDDADLEPVRPWRTKPAIPEPGTFKCMGIMFVTAFVLTLGFVLTAFGAEELGFRMWREETKLAVTILNLPVAALALTALLVWALPTGFWRAAMVTFVYGLVVLAFALLIGSVALAVAIVR